LCYDGAYPRRPCRLAVLCPLWGDHQNAPIKPLSGQYDPAFSPPLARPRCPRPCFLDGGCFVDAARIPTSSNCEYYRIVGDHLRRNAGGEPSPLWGTACPPWTASLPWWDRPGGAGRASLRESLLSRCSRDRTVSVFGFAVLTSGCLTLGWGLWYDDSDGRAIAPCTSPFVLIPNPGG